MKLGEAETEVEEQGEKIPGSFYGCRESRWKYPGSKIDEVKKRSAIAALFHGQSLLSWIFPLDPQP